MEKSKVWWNAQVIPIKKRDDISFRKYLAPSLNSGGQLRLGF